ncbi:MAG TPA: hypothetical protein DF409_14615, partial [Bacteroidales bacterium]|nr:hypothetical protein [Bacteroidales bacterium]
MRLISMILDIVLRVINEFELSNISLNKELGKLFVGGRLDECWGYIENICQKICLQTNQEHEDDSYKLAKELIEYADAKLSDMNLSLNQMEDIFHISQQTINKLFKQYLGCTFHTYVTRQRMESAKEMLISTNMPILSIAEKVGYNNEFTFRRAFK